MVRWGTGCEVTCVWWEGMGDTACMDGGRRVGVEVTATDAGRRGGLVETRGCAGVVRSGLLVRLWASEISNCWAVTWLFGAGGGGAWGGGGAGG